MASTVLAAISRDEIERARLMSEFKYEMDTKSRINTAKWEARNEGREEGRSEGREEGRKESMKNVAMTALAEGMSVEMIHKLTGIDVITIKNLAGGR